MQEERIRAAELAADEVQERFRALAEMQEERICAAELGLRKPAEESASSRLSEPAEREFAPRAEREAAQSARIEADRAAESNPVHAIDAEPTAGDEAARNATLQAEKAARRQAEAKVHTLTPKRCWRSALSLRPGPPRPVFCRCPAPHARRNANGCMRAGATCGRQDGAQGWG